MRFLKTGFAYQKDLYLHSSLKPIYFEFACNKEYFYTENANIAASICNNAFPDKAHKMIFVET